jgi:hypothetical protein
MKTSIKLTALALLMSLGAFAAPHKKVMHRMMSSGKNDEIVFYTLPSQRGIDLRVKKAMPGKTIVIIRDNDGNVLQKDVMTKETIRRGYVLNQLDNGDYSIEIQSANQDFKRDIHIYNEGNIKTFLVKQVV